MHIHAHRSLRSRLLSCKVKLELIRIDIGANLIRVSTCKASFIYLLNQRVSDGWPQLNDHVDDALLERSSSRIDRVHSANLCDELVTILSHLGVFVESPLACKLNELFVVSPEYNLVRLLAQVLIDAALNHGAPLYEKTKSSNDGSLLEGEVANDIGDDLWDAVEAETITIVLLLGGRIGWLLGPNLDHYFD